MRLKTLIITEIVIIAVCLILIFGILINRTHLSEDKCVVSFINFDKITDKMINRTYNMIELNKGLSSGICKVSYTRYDGYLFSP